MLVAVVLIALLIGLIQIWVFSWLRVIVELADATLPKGPELVGCELEVGGKLSLKCGRRCGGLGRNGDVVQCGSEVSQDEAVVCKRVHAVMARQIDVALFRAALLGGYEVSPVVAEHAQVRGGRCKSRTGSEVCSGRPPGPPQGFAKTTIASVSTPMAAIAESWLRASSRFGGCRGREG